MEKKDKKTPIQTPKVRSYPRKYPVDVVDKVTTLIKENKTLGEILELVKPRKRAILRIAKRHNLTLKK